MCVCPARLGPGACDGTRLRMGLKVGTPPPPPKERLKDDRQLIWKRAQKEGWFHDARPGVNNAFFFLLRFGLHVLKRLTFREQASQTPHPHKP